LRIGCLLARADPRDVLIAREGRSIAGLPKGAIVGSGSLRRQAQLLALRPDLKIIPMRGNVGTRLDKIARGDVAATLLALAGLKRLGREDAASAVLDVREMLPAVAQGAIGIEIRAGNHAVDDLLAPIDHKPTASAIAAERACLTVLEGSCRTPIAAYAEIAEGGQLRLRALIAKPDGSRLHRDDCSADVADAGLLGRESGRRLKALAGPGFLG
jgi:hydroxymethylbilane synthase